MKRTVRIIAAAAFAATLVGCSSGYGESFYTSDRSRSLFFSDAAKSHQPTARHGVGDKFGSAIWEQDVALAKAEKFGYASETFASK